MPKKQYFTDDTKANVIDLQWRGNYRELILSYNGQQLLATNREEIMTGKSVELPDGKILEVKLTSGFFASLNVKIDGRHVPRTQGNPAFQLKQVFYLMIILGILNILIGLFLALVDINIEELKGIGFANVAIGIIYIALGYAVSKGSMISLILIALVLFADLIMAAMYTSNSGISGGIYMKVIFIIFVMRGFKYMKEYRADQNNL